MNSILCLHVVFHHYYYWACLAWLHKAWLVVSGAYFWRV